MATEEKKSILVVDDMALWLNTVKAILGADFDLILTADPMRAIELVKNHSFSLVILDKRLSDISGLEVLRQMLNLVPNLRAIMLTGYPDSESAAESLEIGALDYISKGSEDLASELRARVKEALRRKLALAPETYGASENKSDEEEILALIAKGESVELEFKSSARWDVLANRINKELEKIIVKTVAAFLNSEKGGLLLIGVGDKGEIIGLHHDYKTLGKRQDRDGYENFLTTLLLDSYGKDCSPFIGLTFHQIEGKDVCRVVARPSPKAVFVPDDKGGEHLFIRAGNSTRQLSTREAIEYCKIRWK